MKIKDRNFLITGGARRVGKALAMGLAETGGNIVIHYHASEKEAAETVAELQSVGVRAAMVQQDLRDREGVETLISRAEGMIGPLDGIINSASVFYKDDSLPSLEEHLAVHVTAPYIISRAFADTYGKQHSGSLESGCIINIIDSKVDTPSRGFVPYYASKGALTAMTKALAVDLAPQIRVNGIAPGAILAQYDRDESYFEKQGKILPMNRTGNVGDLVHATQFLIVEEFMTGEILRVDGGGHLL